MNIGFGSVDSLMFSIVPLIVLVGFVVVLGIIIMRAIQGGVQWNKNNNSPVLSVKAKVVTKRTEISYHTNHPDNNMAVHNSSSTKYYATFEVESGDRIEFCIPNLEYGMLVEGDGGKLTFQGTRYKMFERYR